jgi:hypothetical protein
MKYSEAKDKYQEGYSTFQQHQSNDSEAFTNNGKNFYSFEDSNNYEHYEQCHEDYSLAKNKNNIESEELDSDIDEKIYFMDIKPNNKKNKNNKKNIQEEAHPQINESQKKLKKIFFQTTTYDITKKKTNENTLKNENNKIEVLEIEKVNNTTKRKKIVNTQYMGRKKKSETIINFDINDKKGAHHKGKTDDIDIKIKRAYLKSLTKFTNFLIDKSPRMKNKGKLLQLNSKIINQMKKRHILLFFDLSAKEYLSQEISTKYRKYEKEHNKKLISYIYEINEETLISVLEKTNRELWHIFCTDNKEENIFQYFNGLCDYIDNDLIKEENTKEYIDKLKYQANNFEEEFIKKQDRNQE